jgi:hypothetical protein
VYHVGSRSVIEPVERSIPVKSRLYFDVRDIPSAARSGLSARKIWIFWKALLLSWLIWLVSVYLGFLAAGSDLSSRWETSRLLPLPGGLFWESWPAVLLLAVGALLMLYVMMAAATKVSRITFEQIRGDDFFSGRDASAFLREHRTPLISTPLAILCGLALAVLLGFVLGLFGRIPGVGPVLVGILSVPAWGLALLTVLLGAGFLACFLLVPSIVACTKGDTFESLFELYSTITAQPWRVLLYWITGFVSRLLGLALFMVFASAAVAFLSWTVSLGMGNQGLESTLSSGLQMVAPEAIPWFANAFNPVAAVAPGQAWTGLAGLLAGLSGVAILLTVKAYWLSSGTSAWTLIYLAVRHRKDGEDLLRRADDEDQREFEKLYGEIPEEPAAAEPVEADTRSGGGTGGSDG